MTTELLQSLLDEHGTPCFVFDVDAFRTRLFAVAALCGDCVGLCYAMKANAFLAGAAADAPLCGEAPRGCTPPSAQSAAFSPRALIEVCSPGELAICMRQGVPPQQIVFSGVQKSAQDIAAAADYGAGIFTAESERHVALLNEAGLSRGKPLPVLLRLSNGSQFGMDASVLTRIVANRAQTAGITLEGLHYFTGTQKKSPKETLDELAFLEEFCTKLKAEHGFTVRKLEYGPGLRTPYFAGEDFSDTLAPLRAILPAVHALAKKYTLTLEMGRFFAAGCGFYLTRVADMKTNGATNYAIVDGGIHHVNYFGQTMAMKTPVLRLLPERAHGEAQTYTLCGSLCTTADILVRTAQFTNLSCGDTIVFENIGAYSVTEGPALFLSRSLPKVVLYRAQTGAKLVRDTVESHVLNG